MQHLSVIAGVSVLGHKVFFSDTVFCFPPPSFLFIPLNIAHHAGKTHADGLAWSIAELKITCLKKIKKEKDKECSVKNHDSEKATIQSHGQPRQFQMFSHSCLIYYDLFKYVFFNPNSFNSFQFFPPGISKKIKG